MGRNDRLPPLLRDKHAEFQIGLLARSTNQTGTGSKARRVDAYQYVRVVRKLAQKLNAIGLGSIRLVGPDTAGIWTGINTYLPEMMSDSVIMGKLDHFGLHNYAGDSGGAENAIKQSAYPSRNFWITEVSNIWDTLTISARDLRLPLSGMPTTASITTLSSRGEARHRPMM